MVTSPTPFARNSARRVAIFCSEGLRPSACCVVDALEIRGYTARLWTGRDASAALQRSRRRHDADLRVVFAPEALDPEVHQRVLRGLDPTARGDVLLIAFDRPCDAIAAIESACGHRAPRTVPRRYTRAVLVHPTLVESKLELGRWVRPGLAGTATFAAVTAAILYSSGSMHGGQSNAPEPLAVSTPLSTPRTLAVGTPQSTRISDDVTLASTGDAWGLRRGSDASFASEVDRAFDENFEEDVIIIIDDDDEPQPRSSVRATANAATNVLYREMAETEHDASASDGPYPSATASAETDTNATAATPAKASGDIPFDSSILLQAPAAMSPALRPTRVSDLPAPTSRTERVSIPSKRRRATITLADPFAL
ncbi:MAG: hypothetical protein JKY37_34175 [Nannocystaceae bacterium]|nr:hypothetical protein [Nannocystaceae bacterium]